MTYPNRNVCWVGNEAKLFTLMILLAPKPLIWDVRQEQLIKSIGWSPWSVQIVLVPLAPDVWPSAPLEDLPCSGNKAEINASLHVNDVSMAEVRLLVEMLSSHQQKDSLGFTIQKPWDCPECSVCEEEVATLKISARGTAVCRRGPDTQQEPLRWCEWRFAPVTFEMRNEWWCTQELSLKWVIHCNFVSVW